MLSPEQLRGHEDVLDDPRARFNRMCEALILSVSHNSRLSLRMVQEIHSLAQHIGVDGAAKEPAMHSVAPQIPEHVPAPPSAADAAPDRAAPAFRIRIASQSRTENPFASILDELAGVRQSVQLAHAAMSAQPILKTAAPEPAVVAIAPTAPQPAADSAAAAEYVKRLKAAVAQQNDVLENLVTGYKANCAEMLRLEDAMVRRVDAPSLAAELEQLRLTMQRQEQHLLALALAVKRLAAVLTG
jgi:hypothetical protein